jgi:hypothetical protein
MRRHTRRLVFAAAATVAFAQGQWLDYRDPKTPRTKDGRPNLSAAAPRLNGRPDLSGVWQAERTPMSEYVQALGEEFTRIEVDIAEVTKHVIDLFWGVPPDQVPLRPNGAAILRQRQQSGQEWQTAQCLPESLPAALMILNFKMIQSPGQIVALFENISPARQIYTDGRPLPGDPNPSWMGYSVGKWEGDTLVVETIGITERAWLDIVGHPRSDRMRITERYRRRDFGHMDLEVTLEDPRYYTRPFGFKTTLTLIPDSDVLEYICIENAKNLARAAQ